MLTRSVFRHKFIIVFSLVFALFCSLRSLTNTDVLSLFAEADRSTTIAYSENENERTKMAIYVAATRAISNNIKTFVSADSQAVIKDLFTRIKNLIDLALQDKTLTLPMLKLIESNINEINTRLTSKIKMAITSSPEASSPDVLKFINDTLPSYKQPLSQKITNTTTFVNDLTRVQRMRTVDLDKIKSYFSMADQITQNILFVAILPMIADLTGVFDGIKNNSKPLVQRQLITDSRGFSRLLEKLAANQLIVSPAKETITIMQEQVANLLKEIELTSQPQQGGTSAATLQQAVTPTETLQQTGVDPVALPGAQAGVGRGRSGEEAKHTETGRGGRQQDTTPTTKKPEPTPTKSALIEKINAAVNLADFKARILAIQEALKGTSASMNKDEKDAFRKEFTALYERRDSMKLDEVNSLVVLFSAGFDNSFVFAKNQQRWLNETLKELKIKVQKLQSSQTVTKTDSVQPAAALTPQQQPATQPSSLGVSADDLKKLLNEEKDSIKLIKICTDALDFLIKDTATAEKNLKKSKSLLSLVLNEVRLLYQKRKGLSVDAINGLIDIIKKANGISQASEVVKPEWLDTLNVTLNVVMANSAKDYLAKINAFSQAVKFVANSTNNFDKTFLVDSITNLVSDREKMTLADLKAFEKMLQDLKEKAAFFSGLSTSLSAWMQNVQARVLNMETKIIQEKEAAAKLLR